MMIFIIAGWAEGAQPAFLWLLLKGERGKVGVFGLGIEAGAVFLHPGEVAVPENLRAGVIVLQGKSRKTHVTLLQKFST